MATELIFVDKEKVLELMVRKLGPSHPLAKRLPDRIMQWRKRKVISQCRLDNGFILELDSNQGVSSRDMGGIGR